VFVLGGRGVFRQIDESFAGEFFVEFGASGKLGVFVGSVVGILEFESFDFELEDSKLAALALESLGKFPVARHTDDATIGPSKTKNGTDGQKDVIKTKPIVL